MAQPIVVNLNGSIQAQPSASTSLVPSLTNEVLLSVNKVYSYRSSDSISINSPSVPVTLSLGSIAKVRFMYFKVIGAAVTFVFTSPAGSATLKVSDLILWSDPNEGDQITAITLQGVSDLEYILLGD